MWPISIDLYEKRNKRETHNDGVWCVRDNHSRLSVFHGSLERRCCSVPDYEAPDSDMMASQPLCA